MFTIWYLNPTNQWNVSKLMHNQDTTSIRAANFVVIVKSCIHWGEALAQRSPGFGANTILSHIHGNQVHITICNESTDPALM